jgi:large repetitive protein
MKTKLVWLLCAAEVASNGQSPGTFKPTGSMGVARWGHTATLLNKGKVLIAGGRNGNGLLTSAELFDPATGAFIPTGDMLSVEDWHSAILLPDGRVSIFGGMSNPTNSNTDGIGSELYDPSIGKFVQTGQSVSPIVASKGALLQDGRVFVMGNVPYTPELVTEVYDPLSGTFAATPPFPNTSLFQFALYTLTGLADGRVLITGSQGTYVATIYDPASGEFNPTDPRSEGLETATLLVDGNVLFTGADDGSGPSPEAKLYSPSTGTFSNVGSTVFLPRGIEQLTGIDRCCHTINLGSSQSPMRHLANVPDLLSNWLSNR